MTHPQNGDIDTLIKDTHSGWRNSYREAYIWIKGELLDIHGMCDAIIGRETVIKQMLALQTKMRNEQLELDKAAVGKKSMKNMLKKMVGKS